MLICSRNPAATFTTMDVHLRNDLAQREKRLRDVDRAIQLCCVDDLV
jgi:hypothetical protein